jgi:hypothetical protein
VRIDDDHLYHGAALNQIAEDPHFTAINALSAGRAKLRNSYRINDDIGVHLKYCTKPSGQVKEYKFTFTTEHLADLRKVNEQAAKTYLVLICVDNRQICCLSLTELEVLIRSRREAIGGDEDQYVILVTIPAGKRFRVYVSVPGQRGKMLGKPLVVSRNSFPSRLFEKS